MSDAPIRVRAFDDLLLNLSAYFTNDQYQDRASNTNFGYSGFAIHQSISNTYIIKKQYPIYDAQYLNQYAITGEYNLNFNVSAATSKATLHLTTSVYIMKDTLRELSRKKEEFITYDVDVYTPHVGEQVPYVMTLVFKKVKNTLHLASAELALPDTICDEWFNKFVMYNAQRKSQF